MSMLGFGLTAFLMGSATMAWFTDSKTAGPTTFAAGTIVVTPSYTGTWTTGYSNLAPGQTVDNTINIKNDGTLDMKYRMYLQLDTTDSAGYTYSAALANKATITIKDAAGTTTLAGPYTLANFNNGAALVRDGVNKLAPGASQSYKAFVTLPSDADNTYKNTQVKVTFKVDATQTDNTGWGE
jgi:predicted ribosomally synthesized peptide with SipW-like signal peptide